MASPTYQKKLSFVVLFSSLFLLLPSAQSTNVKYCDKKGKYDVKVKGVEISPDPVVSGEPATFNIAASTGQTISGGKVLIEVYFFGVHVHTETRKLSEEISCPIKAGDFVLSHTQTLPGFTPPGSYTLKMTMVDDKDRLLSCIKFDFKIHFGTSVSDN